MKFAAPGVLEGDVEGERVVVFLAPHRKLAFVDLAKDFGRATLERCEPLLDRVALSIRRLDAVEVLDYRGRAERGRHPPPIGLVGHQDLLAVVRPARQIELGHDVLTSRRLLGRSFGRRLGQFVGHIQPQDDNPRDEWRDEWRSVNCDIEDRVLRMTLRRG
jgi:hypothetical protein